MPGLFEVKIEHDDVGSGPFDGLHKLEMGWPAFIGDHVIESHCQLDLRRKFEILQVGVHTETEFLRTF